MLFGWMNTGHQRAKIDNEAKSHCPHCLQENETQEHVITCSNGRVKACRYNALVTLRSAITTKGGSSRVWDVLHGMIRMWTNSGGADPTVNLDKYQMNSALKDTVKRAIAE
jgi:hypothetical protein